MAARSALRIELLGGFRLIDEGGPAARVPSVRQQQVIGLLILHARRGPIPRQRIAGSLWPDSSDEQALTNLRRELHHLRESWPRLDALVEAGTRTLAWRDRSGVVVDVVAFEAAAARGLAGEAAALQDAAALYRGDLLPDCTGEWIDADRERLRQSAKQVLARLVAVLEQERTYGDAIDRAQQLLQLDPLDEQGWCALMRCHARRGDRAAALHVYQQCVAVLKKELGVQPSASTRLAYREVLELDTTAAPVPSPPPRTAIYPLVGRQAEWKTVLGAWRAVAPGQIRLCLIRGEAGIGKTRLAEELVDWSRLNGVTAVTARCYAGEGRLAYAPIADWLKHDALQPMLLQVESADASDVARLRPELLTMRAGVAPPDAQLERWQRLRFFEALARVFRAAAPLVLVLDDLQWADADTLEWLHYFARATPGARCLVVGTVRAEEEQDNPPLGRLLAQLERDSRLTAVDLGPLDRTATAQLAAEVAEHPIDEAALVRTFRETEGHPLFIIERERMALTRAQSVATTAEGSSTTEAGLTAPGAGDAAPAAAPPQVQSIVAARLALLSDEARQTAEVAAAVGRDFRFDILARASDLEEDVLVRALDELWRRHIVRVQSDERWDFSHDRIREVAYAGIGPARRRLIHRRIAQGMELLWAERLDEVSASIAVHLDRGGQAARAVPFLERAAAVAARVSAHAEAARCLTHALSIVDRLPSGRERDAQELALRSTLSVSLNSRRGYAAVEVEQNLDRVFALLASVERDQLPVRWLWVAFTLRFMLGDIVGTRQAAEQALVRSRVDPASRCEAHHAMGGMLSSVGEHAAAREHFEAALDAYDERHPQRSALGSDLGVFAHAWYSHTLWLLGDERSALAHAGEAMALAQRLDHKYSQALALAYAALLHQMRLDREQVRVCAEAAIDLCERYEFGYYGDWARVLIGWVRGHEQPEAGVQIIESALAGFDESRAQARRPYYLSLLAETCARMGQRDRVASILDRAIDLAETRGDSWWLPALYLQRGDLHDGAARESMLQRALALARSQHALGLEHRIAAVHG